MRPCCREFCLGNIVFECAEGTVCTGMVNGQSPCTMGNSARVPCPGEFDDFACCDSEHYCLGGFKHACGAGKKCRGSVDGGSPCHDEPKDDTSPSPPHPSLPDTCSGGDWACTSSTSYCQGGCEIKCPKNTVCRDYAPCVHKSDCYDHGKAPTCSDADWTCLDDSTYCTNQTQWQCPDGTKCTGSVNGQSPCTPDVDHRCPGPFDDFTCVDKTSYCLGGYVQSCATNTFCDPAADGSDNPCKAVAPTQPACPQPDYACVNYNQYCAGNIAFDCPTDSVCRGLAPCAIQPDETCSEGDFTCLDHRDYCFQGETLRCPDGFKCVSSPDGKSNPCQEDAPAQMCPAAFDDYACFDLGHYCLDGMSIECPANTYCYGDVAEDESPCQLTPPTLLNCTAANWTCLDRGSYCFGNVTYYCPEDTECAGLAPYPCVERNWCPVSDGEDHPSKPSEPECAEPDWHCYDKRKYCHKGEILHCPHGTYCSGQQVDGRSCCVEEPVRPVCGGAWSDYQCINHRAFCLGGYAMDCAEGTVCLGSTRGESPCKWPTGGETAPPACPNGEGACTGDNTFCSGGLEFTCPGGAVCRAGCCVYQTPDDTFSPACPGCY